MTFGKPATPLSVGAGKHLEQGNNVMEGESRIDGAGRPEIIEPGDELLGLTQVQIEVDLVGLVLRHRRPTTCPSHRHNLGFPLYLPRVCQWGGGIQEAEGGCQPSRVIGSGSRRNDTAAIPREFFQRVRVAKEHLPAVPGDVIDVAHEDIVRPPSHRRRTVAWPDMHRCFIDYFLGHAIDAVELLEINQRQGKFHPLGPRADIEEGQPVRPVAQLDQVALVQRRPPGGEAQCNDS